MSVAREVVILPDDFHLVARDGRDFHQLVLLPERHVGNVILVLADIAVADLLGCQVGASRLVVERDATLGRGRRFSRHCAEREQQQKQNQSEHLSLLG